MPRASIRVPEACLGGNLEGSEDPQNQSGASPQGHAINLPSRLRVESLTGSELELRSTEALLGCHRCVQVNKTFRLQIYPLKGIARGFYLEDWVKQHHHSVSILLEWTHECLDVYVNDAPNGFLR